MMQVHQRPLDGALNIVDQRSFSQLLLSKISKYLFLNIVCKLSATSKERKEVLWFCDD